MEKSVSGSGTLAPTVQQDVSFAVSGTVTAVPVAVGQTVTAGQTLATVDTLKLQADLLQAKSTLASAQAKLSDAKTASTGSTASKAQIAAAQAQVDVAQSGVDTAQTAMTGATLVAPVAGLLTAVNLEVGDAVSGSSSQGQNPSSSSSATTTAQFTIVDTDELEGGRHRLGRGRRAHRRRRPGGGHARRCDDADLRHDQRDRAAVHQRHGRRGLPGDRRGHGRPGRRARRRQRDREAHLRAPHRRAHRPEPRGHDDRREVDGQGPGRRGQDLDGRRDRRRDVGQPHRDHAGPVRGRQRGPGGLHARRGQRQRPTSGGTQGGEFPGGGAGFYGGGTGQGGPQFTQQGGPTNG